MPNRRDCGLHVVGTISRGARHHDVRTCLVTECRCVGIDAAIDLDVKFPPSSLAELRRSADFVEYLRHEGLTAKTRNHGHAQQQIDVAKVWLHRVERRCRASPTRMPACRIAASVAPTS